MAALASLATSYRQARERFFAAAQQAGARCDSYPHPLLGVEGEALAVDVAALGPAEAELVIVVVCATHGVEGYCGSALQTHWLTYCASDLPADVRLLMVHGLNPYGFSWVRRVNEDNVDLNRNFVDWHVPAPENYDYTTVHDLVVPATWDEQAQADSTSALFGFVNEWGLDRLQAVLSGGQYRHPDGVFYGGTAPVWSHRWLRHWAAEALSDASEVRIIDLHTGLGPWGVGELIVSPAPGDAEFVRAAAVWGDVRSMHGGDSVSAVLDGDWSNVAHQFAPQATVIAVSIEYGTVDLIAVMQALRADAWLHARGDPRGPDAAAIRAQVRAAFADDDPAWIAACWPRFHQVLTAAASASL